MEKNRTGKDFIGVSTIILISKVLGIARTILLASFIGTTLIADAYSQVFNIVPPLLFAAVGMALSSVNIPNMTYYLNERNEQERKRYVSALFTQIAIISAVIAALGIILAPLVTKLILPGTDKSVMGTAVSLTRLMFPIIIFICLAYIATSILQVHKHFLLSSAISIPFNLIIIAAIVLKCDILIIGLTTTVGWLLQFLIQIPRLRKDGYYFSLKPDFKNQHIIDIYRKLVPILLGNAALQLCILTDTTLGSNVEGHISAISYGSTLFMTITSIFIVAMSTVTFPDLSKYCLDKDFEKLRKLLLYIFKVLSFILIPFVIVVIFYNKEIIELFYKRGAFNEKSVLLTAPAFLLYSFCVIGYLFQEVFNRVFYALKKFKIPAMLSLLCIVLNLIIVLVVYKPYGIKGIAGATAVSFTIYAILMYFIAKKELGNFLGKEYVGYILKLLLPAAGMALIFLVFGHFHFSGWIKGFLLPLAGGGLVYCVVVYVTGLYKELIKKP
ncbi:MAG: murein biosynthesis integral membrane protein MurJ [Bacillota bacterium]|nr:murein biosynthesis integral membrane protein MurJ [Bacillota bacterium]